MAYGFDPTAFGPMGQIQAPAYQQFGTGGGSAPVSSGGGGFWNDIGGFVGNLGNLYGTFRGAQNSQDVINQTQAGYGMARGAYNPQMFGMSGIGGTGFSVSSPTNGGPGTINASLGAMNPLYGQFAGYGSGMLGESRGLAANAAGGAQGAYQSALASMMPQLQNMQSNLLAANNNSLFQRGQLGSGSYGQYGNPNNPTNLTTASLGAGFAQQDLQAIMAAQNQGLNFFNSNLQGANALGALGMGGVNTGLGMINAQNNMGQMPLQYAGLVENSKLGATGDLAGMIRAAQPQGANLSGGYGGLGTTLGQPGGMNSIGNLISGAGSLWNDVSNWFGGGGFSGAGGQAAAPGLAAVPGIGSSNAAATAASGWNPMAAGGTGGIQGGGGFSPVQGMSALNAGMDIMGDIKNWQSGATGKDTLMGAKTGWDIGNSFVPGIGGVIGAPIGAAAGAISSAFGGGIRSQESKNWLDYTKQFNSLSPQQQSQYSLSVPPQQAFQNIQGVMNAHNNSPGHSEGIEQVWGRNNAQGFVDSLANEINSAVKSGKITQNMSPQEQYQKVIAPWLQSKGAGINPNQRTSSGQPEGQALIGSIENIMANFEMGNLTGQTQAGIKGQTIQGLPNFVG